MIDYVARALAKQALDSSGGGGSVNTYSKDELDVKFNEVNEKISDNNEVLKNEISEELTDEISESVIDEITENTITISDTIIIDGGTI